ncbi:Uncharacterised protein [Moraxella lacunata]|uniref:Uncharacterized protein n=1 Tax=Moraxella lacunata TaxID=477 RepID=A0A378UC42_MORLA|nr:hypothetical protein [Moraxella lacunata]STZ74946.1 Uncharacterised protein [Moraxella lacunata]
MLKKILKVMAFFLITLTSIGVAQADTKTFTPSDTYNTVWVTFVGEANFKMINESGKDVSGINYCIHWGKFKHCDSLNHTKSFNPSNKYIIGFRKKERDSYPLTVTTTLGKIESISEISPNLSTPGMVKIYPY